MQTAQSKNKVMDSESANRKLRRMALQVAEQNIEERLLIIAGIEGNGQVIAAALARELKQIGNFEISQINVRINKKDPLSARIENLPNLEDKVVILVDDVANTGRTMMYALKPFLDAHPKKIQTLALVERSHKLFPVQTDYTGLSITTTLQEHIVVETENGEIIGASLF